MFEFLVGFFQKVTQHLLTSMTAMPKAIPPSTPHADLNTSSSAFAQPLLFITMVASHVSLDDLLQQLPGIDI